MNVAPTDESRYMVVDNVTSCQLLVQAVHNKLGIGEHDVQKIEVRIRDRYVSLDEEAIELIKAGASDTIRVTLYT